MTDKKANLSDPISRTYLFSCLNCDFYGLIYEKREK